jgi:MFS family permease
VKWLMRIYRLLLRLYPSDFQDEFGEEMTAVFAQVVRESAEQGWFSLTAVCLREIRDWPGSVLQERLRARRSKMSSNRVIEEKPLLRRELLAALIIFLLPLFSIFAITNINLPWWMEFFGGILWGILFWGAVTFALILAIMKGLPPWSLSYLGFVLMPGIILSLSPRFGGWIYPFFIQSFGPRSTWSLPIRLTYGGIFAFILLFLTLLSALILVNLLRLLPHTRNVWRRIQADWTQLSFMLYGGLVFSIILAFEEYQHEELWKFIAWVCLALGAWLYLRAKRQKQRILALIGGASGAMWIVALSKWMLIPLQKWPMGYPVSPSETTRLVETGSTMIGWVWILLMLIAPVLLNLLPPSPPPNIQEDMAPA